MAELVFIIGATGKVGRELVDQIYDKGDTDSNLHRNPTKIVGVASSHSFLYDQKGLTENAAKDFAQRRTSGKEYQDTMGLIDVINDSKNPVNMIDVTASTGLLEFHKKIIAKTKHKMVTANKNPLTMSSYKVFQQLTSEPQRYGYRCSVMAGAEAVDKLLDLRDLGEPPQEIVGSFSGTLGYLISEIESGRKFSSSLADAISKGYTEPDPAIDLTGEDVAKKILILVRTAGFDANLSDVKVTPFIPKEYLSRNLSDPLRGLDDIDRYLSSRMKEAKEKGGTLRYIAKFALNGNKPEISVGLEFVKLDDPIGKLRGTANKMAVRASVYGDSCYSIEAPGAGIGITALNIRRDLLHQIKSRYVSGSNPFNI